MTQNSKPIIGRLAPSPTGAQHIGNARTYLLAWLSVRSKNGTLFLRMEDIDSPRVKKGADLQAIEDIRWLGLDWDHQFLVQSNRISYYKTALESLAIKELVYPCTCTRGDVIRAASAPHEDGKESVYPQTCAHRIAADFKKLEGTNFCWRFRSPLKQPDFIDGYKGFIEGPQGFQSNDFVVWRMGDSIDPKNSMPAYQLAVVIDDAFQNITQVVRGDDLVSSTPKQILLYDSLNLTPPEFFHLPLVIGEDGKRLAKRHGDTRLASLREQGVKPEALLGLLGYSCGWLKKIEPLTIKELLYLFDFKKIPSQPFVLTNEHLKTIGYEV